MSEIKKLRVHVSKFIDVNDIPQPVEYRKRFTNELRSAGAYFVSVGLAKKIKDGPLYWEPLPSLALTLKPLMEGRVDVLVKRLLKQSRSRVPDEILTHLAVFLGYMFCFVRLDEELGAHETRLSSANAQWDEWATT